MQNKPQKPFWHHVALGIILFIVLSVVYVRLILPIILGNGQILDPLLLTSEFLTNANNLGGTLNAVTGLLSGVALILALYAVKIQSDGLTLQAESLKLSQQQTSLQVEQFTSAFLLTSLEVNEKRLAELEKQLKDKFSYPRDTVDALFTEEKSSPFAEFLHREMEELIAKAKDYRIRIYYLHAKIDDEITKAALGQERFNGSSEFKDFHEFMKSRNWPKN